MYEALIVLSLLGQPPKDLETTWENVWTGGTYETLTECVDDLRPLATTIVARHLMTPNRVEMLLPSMWLWWLHNGTFDLQITCQRYDHVDGIKYME